jgi:hypothetical protein
MMYSVVKKKADNKISYMEPELLSIHDTKEKALRWARHYCFVEHGECADLSGDFYMEQCDITAETIYGPDRWFENVFFVRDLPAITTGLPDAPDPEDDMYGDEDQEEDNERQDEEMRQPEGRETPAESESERQPAGRETPETELPRSVALI